MASDSSVIHLHSDMISMSVAPAALNLHPSVILKECGLYFRVSSALINLRSEALNSLRILLPLKLSPVLTSMNRGVALLRLAANGSASSMSLSALAAQV